MKKRVFLLLSVVWGVFFLVACSSSTGSGDNQDLSAALSTPANEATAQEIDLELSWNSNGLIYDVYVGTSADNLKKVKNGIAQTSYAPKDLIYETKYYWKVEAKNETSSKTSEVWSFTTKDGPVVSLTSPTNNEIVHGEETAEEKVKVTLVWSGNADVYNIYLHTDSAKTNLVKQVEGITDKSYALDDLNYGTTYYWQVVAIKKEVSAKSLTQQFTTNGKASDIVELTEPKNNSAIGKENTIVLKWSGEAQKYSLKLWSDDKDNPNFEQNDLTSTRKEISIAGVGVKYYWQVTGTKENGETGKSEIWSFVNDDAPTVTLSNPANGATQQPSNPTLSWSGENAKSYTVYWGTDASNLTNKSETLTATSYKLSGLESTTYYWQVVASTEYGTTVASEVWSFTPKARITRAELVQMIAEGKDVTQVNTSGITDMSYLMKSVADYLGESFNNCSVVQNFNQDISGWDVSKVKNMEQMFYYAVTFNQDIGDWDVSSVTNMRDMFNHAEVFNQDINEWVVSSVTDMGYMFMHADAFNQDIGDWVVSSVTNMKGMFSSTYAFNQDIGSWDVSSVTDMGNMFSSAKAFNQDIGDWDVSRVVDHWGFDNETLSSWTNDEKPKFK